MGCLGGCVEVEVWRHTNDWPLLHGVWSTTMATPCVTSKSLYPPIFHLHLLFFFFMSLSSHTWKMVSRVSCLSYFPGCFSLSSSSLVIIIIIAISMLYLLNSMPVWNVCIGLGYRCVLCSIAIHIYNVLHMMSLVCL